MQDEGLPVLAALRLPELLYINFDINEWSQTLKYILIEPPNTEANLCLESLISTKSDFVLQRLHAGQAWTVKSHDRDTEALDLDTIQVNAVCIWAENVAEYCKNYCKIIKEVSHTTRIVLFGSFEEQNMMIKWLSLTLIFRSFEFCVAKRILAPWEQRALSSGEVIHPVVNTVIEALENSGEFQDLVSEDIEARAVDYRFGVAPPTPGFARQRGHFSGGIRVMDDVIFHADTGALLNRTGAICAESLHWLMLYRGDLPGFYAAKETDWRTWRIESLTVDRTIDQLVVPIGTRFPTNIYHWFNDLAVKLWLRELAIQAGALPASTPILLGSPASTSFQREALAALTDEDTQIILGLPGYTRLKRAYCITHRNSSRHLMLTGRPQAFYKWLKRRSEAKISTSSSIAEAVYISRMDTPKRRLINEQQVIDYLKSRHFLILVPGKMTLREQMSAVSGARLIIGPHGAGLFNVIFSEIGSTLCEIRTPLLTDLSYRYLAQFRGSIYCPCLAEPVPNERPNPIDFDMHLDIGMLENVVRLVV